jgi:hypothetical protein
MDMRAFPQLARIDAQPADDRVLLPVDLPTLLAANAAAQAAGPTVRMIHSGEAKCADAALISQLLALFGPADSGRLSTAQTTGAFNASVATRLRHRVHGEIDVNSGT